jgi:hypothetical protein
MWHEIMNGNRAVKVFDGNGEERFVGEVVGYLGQPSYIIRTPDGHTQHFAASLVSPVSDDEALKFWMHRAEELYSEKLHREIKEGE